MSPQPGDQLAVVSQSGRSVTLVDAVDHTVRRVLEVPAEPHELCFDAEHRVVYCSIPYVGGAYGAHHGHNSLVVVVDPDAGEVVDVLDLAPENGPHGLALDPVRRLLYVSVEAGPAGGGGVVVIDTTTRRVVHRIDTLAPGPHWFAIDPTRRRGWAANKEAPFVTAVDLITGEVLDKVAVPGSEGVAVRPDGGLVAVAGPHLGSDAAPGVRLIDPASHEIVATLPTRDRVLPVHWTVRGVLLAGEMRADTPVGRLSVWADPDADTTTRATEVEVGHGPLTITSSPDGGRAYVAAVLGGTVTAVDLTDPARPAVLDTLDVPGADAPGAHGLAYVPARP
jgi:DNA-binding beta-propeller fold protein YncE